MIYDNIFILDGFINPFISIWIMGNKAQQKLSLSFCISMACGNVDFLVTVMGSEMKKWFVKLWLCWIWRFHEWTCAAAEGIPANPKQIADGIDGFYDYAKMYCKRCGKESERSRQSRGEHERLAKNGR